MPGEIVTSDVVPSLRFGATSDQIEVARAISLPWLCQTNVAADIQR